VLIAVSGGPDSIALVRAMQGLKCAGSGRLIVAHFNHRLRGPESEADAAFVAEFAARWGPPLEIGVPPDAGICPRRGEGLEAAARRARYQFLSQTAAKLAARYLAVAHTADDQAETILHRILRGTGIRGLAGMSRARPISQATTLIRPLLGFRRTEIRAYLNDLGQPYRRDSSNLDLRRTRNRIRQHLLPELAAQFNPDVVAALLRLGSLAGDAQLVVAQNVEQLMGRCLGESIAGEVRLELSPLEGAPRFLLRELLMAVWRQKGWPLRDMGFQQWDLLAALTEQGVEGRAGLSAQQAFPGGIMAEVVSGRLRLSRRQLSS
jgi:tRNA(Ile)-lysidine synthase